MKSLYIYLQSALLVCFDLVHLLEELCVIIALVYFEMSMM